MTKSICVVVGDKTYDREIRPGTTAGDVLSECKLSDKYWLSDKNGVPLGSTEEIFDSVADNSKLFASTEARVA